MKIQVAVDQNSYSSHAVLEVAKLAANTWANVSLLGVQPKHTTETKAAGDNGGPQIATGPVQKALFDLRRDFFAYFKDKACPYPCTDPEGTLNEVSRGIYAAASPAEQGKKDFTLRMRIGSPVKEILAEARERESDLIVLGCDQDDGCGWSGDAGVPRKVANDAPCSVLVVKKKKKIDRIICCLDHDRVSQSSLEMINQMVTLHGAQLTVIGLSDHMSLKAEVEKKMDNILRYYYARDIDPWIEMVEIASLDAFIAQESRRGLMALWMGKESILAKVFPRSKVDKLIKGSDTSVLILR